MQLKKQNSKQGKKTKKLQSSNRNYKSKLTSLAKTCPNVKLSKILENTNSSFKVSTLPLLNPNAKKSNN
jgi:hypothetical protein